MARTGRPAVIRAETTCALTFHRAISRGFEARDELVNPAAMRSFDGDDVAGLETLLQHRGELVDGGGVSAAAFRRQGGIERFHVLAQGENERDLRVDERFRKLGMEALR